MTMEALIGPRLHTPEGIVPGRALLLEGGTIRDIVADDAIPSGARITRLAGGLLAAGFIDLQVNGGGGVMFNDAPTTATIAAIGRAHRALGTTAFLPTFISGPRDGMARAISAVREALDQAMPGVLGIHFEGPHINLARRGAHNEHEIRALAEKDIELLTSLGAGRTLVTLAPECVELHSMGTLAARGVIVAAGHTEADAYAFHMAAPKLTGVTHLFNAMSPLGHRELGAAGEALTRTTSPAASLPTVSTCVGRWCVSPGVRSPLASCSSLPTRWRLWGRPPSMSSAWAASACAWWTAAC